MWRPPGSTRAYALFPYTTLFRSVQALQTRVTPDGNEPAIEGWYENVRPLTEREKTLIREAAKAGDEAAQKQALGITHWIDNLSYEEDRKSTRLNSSH